MRQKHLGVLPHTQLQQLPIVAKYERPRYEKSSSCISGRGAVVCGAHRVQVVVIGVVERDQDGQPRQRRRQKHAHGTSVCSVETRALKTSGSATCTLM